MTQKTDTAKGRKPDWLIYSVPTREGAPWTRIGALWLNNHTEGYSGDLEFAPLNGGRIVLMPPPSGNTDEGSVQ